MTRKTAFGIMLFCAALVVVVVATFPGRHPPAPRPDQARPPHPAAHPVAETQFDPALGLGQPELRDSLPRGAQQEFDAIKSQLSHIARPALSAAEAEALAYEYMALQSLTVEYLATIARVEKVGASTLRVEVPAYPEFGTQILSAWKSKLEEVLGEQRAREALAENAGEFDAFFLNFGNMTQSLVITAVWQDDQTPAYRVQREAVATVFLAGNEQPTLGSSVTGIAWNSLYQPYMFEGTRLSYLQEHLSRLTPQN